MMRVLVVSALGVVALVVQSVVGYHVAGRRVPLDLGLVTVVSGSIFYGPTVGLLSGSVVGLAQDALSGGVLGVAGLAKTLVGFVAGVLATQFIVSSVLPRFVVFAAMTWLHGVCFLGVYAMIEGAGLGSPWRMLLLQSVLNGAIGVVFTRLVEHGPEAWRRRRLQPRGGGGRFHRQ